MALSIARYCRSLLLLAVITCSAHAAEAETIAQVTNPRKANGGWVSDMAHVLDASTERRLNDRLAWLERKTTAEMAVVTIQRTEGQSPKQFSTSLFNAWGIGKKSKNNGVLLLLVMDAHRVEVETGRGMGDVLPDDYVQRVLIQQAVPRFREDDYAGGVLAAVRTFTEKIATQPKTAQAVTPNTHAATSPKTTPAKTPQTATYPDTGSVQAQIPSYYNHANNYNSDNYSNSNYGGNSNIYNDNYSSRSAPSVPWMALLLGVVGLPMLGIAVLKSRERHCPRCNGLMHELDEAADDAVLADDQRFEESLGGVNYRVWRCAACNTQQMERAKRWSSGYNECPRCRHQTLSTQRVTVEQATYDHAGEERRTQRCEFPGCSFYDVTTRAIAQLARPSSDSSPHSHSSFSDSSFSASSSSDSSSSSFGGGSSDGGGAGASW